MRTAATFCALTLAATGAIAMETATIDDLAWLAGAWESAGGEPGSGEFWTPPAGGTLFGLNRRVRDGRTVDYEFLIIRAGGF